MKKLVVGYSLAVLSFAPLLQADGGGVGLQLGGLGIGLGGSSEGPIIGVGPAPDNGRSFSPVIIPGSKRCGKCANERHYHRYRHECHQCGWHHCHECGYHGQAEGHAHYHHHHNEQ